MKNPIYIPKLIPEEFSHFYTHVLLRNCDISERKGDNQVPTAKAIMGHEVIFETLQERIWPTIEEYLGEQLIPTYAYARLYSNGDILEKHVDRPACEISVTIQLGRSHHYSWPIYMGNQRFDMGEGSAIIYPGCDIQHWRDNCDGPEGYYSGQVFCHYVRKNGKNTDHVGDKTHREIFSYCKNRTYMMETK